MVRKVLSPSFKKLYVVLTLGLIAACAQDSGTVGNTDVVIANPADPNKVVCTPFDGADPALANNGLIANLYYLDDSQPRYQSVVDLLANGHRVDVNIYMNKVNVPTRPFDQGFITNSGILVTNQNGNTLYEYFGMHMESFLQLRDSDPEGDYDFALLADDGAILSVDNGSGFTTYINDDGTHPTKMMCSTAPLHMVRGQKIPMKLDYHQGPRYHIAVVMAWRPHVDGQDPMCGQSGNATFWDSTQIPSAPTGWNALVSRGWSALATENFVLPTSLGSSNPCADQQGEVIISNFMIVSVTNSSITVSWDTNIPADSQIHVAEYDSDSQRPFTTVSDSTMQTSHRMTFSGMFPFTLYNIYVSSSNGSSSASNDVSTFRTLR